MTWAESQEARKELCCVCGCRPVWNAKRRLCNACYQRSFRAPAVRPQLALQTDASTITAAARARQMAATNLFHYRRKATHCECCQKPSDSLDMHHDDYLKPLEVRLLCRRCHRRWHVENGPGLNRDIDVPYIGRGNWRKAVAA